MCTRLRYNTSMKLTYKVKHGRDFSEHLKKAKKVAEFAIQNRDKLSSANVKHIGLPSAISSQVLRKYGRNKRCKKISNANLIVPGQGIKRAGVVITITCLKLELELRKSFQKVNQIELDNAYAYITVTVEDEPQYRPKVTIGIDRNATGHIIVAACPETGKVYKLGKKAGHIRKKYKQIRRELQHKGKFKKLKAIKRRESNIIRDLNHKISREIINLAKGLKGRVVMEELKGIRSRAKSARSFRHALHSWSFYQFQTFLEYKAQLAGVPVEYIDPYHTSKCCSRCGLVGNRQQKSFKCNNCSHVDHADSNAAFNIALVGKGVFDFSKKVIAGKGVLAPRNELCLASNSRTPRL
nr:MAG: endonculease [Podoviridae sp. ctka020]